jgi:ATP-dependent Clp protease ATP-binding subunit ClpC
MQALGQLDPEAMRVVALAQAEAERLGHGYIGTDHVLVALLLHESDAGRILRELGVETELLRAHIDRVVARPSPAPAATSVVRAVKQAMELAFVEVDAEGAERAAPVHLLLGLIEQHDGVAAHVLADLGVTAERVRELRT